MASDRTPKIEGGRLHGVSLSPYVRKVRVVLAIKGIDYELVNVMPGAVPPEFRAISPLAKVPVWEEGDGWTLPDSSTICAYLERRVPTPSIAPPGDARAWARDLFWEEYADTRLVEATGAVFFQRVVRQRVLREPSDESIVRRHLEEILPPVFEQLETLFIERDGADPDVLSIGNIAVWSACVNLAHAGVTRESDEFPGLVAFLADFARHPAVVSVLEEEHSALGGA